MRIHPENSRSAREPFLESRHFTRYQGAFTAETEH
jgi:hypothetical protein